MTKRTFSLAALALALPILLAQARGPAGRAPSTGGVSPHETISAVVQGRGYTSPRVTITYGRPFSKNPRGDDIRKIWGTVVPWNQVWRLGADEATTLISSVPLKFGDLNVPPGAYSLYMFPVENGPSQLIINKAIGQWGIPYPDSLKAQELGRVDLKKETVSPQVDQLTLKISPKQGGGGGTLVIVWETTQYSVDFTVAPPPATAN